MSPRPAMGPCNGEILTTREIAKRLNISHATVQAIETRAMRKLAKLLVGRGWDSRSLERGAP